LKKPNKIIQWEFRKIFVTNFLLSGTKRGSFSISKWVDQEEGEAMWKME